MKCPHCSRKADVNIKPLGPLCKECFCSAVERRRRKDCRLNAAFRKDDRIFAGGKLALFLVNRIVGELPKRIVKSKAAANKVVVQLTSDDIVCDALSRIFKAEAPRKPGSRDIEILRTVSDEEAAAYAKFNRVDFRPNSKPAAIIKILNALQKRYPETKGSAVNAVMALRNL